MGLNLFRFRKSTNSDQPLARRYQVVSQLGSGGFSQTFLAEDLHLPGHPRCVVKQLKPQVRDPSGLQTARRLFDTEAQVLYQLGTHQQIPRLLAHFEDNQEFYLVQELIDGNPLTQELAAGQRWPEQAVVTMLLDLLQVLVFVHAQNVIHRDIKPSNLIRRHQDNRIVLIDFGAVKQVSTQIINPNSNPTQTIAIGTQGYMPNEQLCGNPRFSSDIYAVGMLGIQALIGIHPKHLSIDPDTYEVNWRDRLPTRADGTPLVNAELAAILDRMVFYDFRDRYATAAEAIEALRTVAIAPIHLEVTEPYLPSPTLPLAAGVPPDDESEWTEHAADASSEPSEATAPPPAAGSSFQAAFNSSSPTQALTASNRLNSSQQTSASARPTPSTIQTHSNPSPFLTWQLGLIPLGLGAAIVAAAATGLIAIPGFAPQSNSRPDPAETSSEESPRNDAVSQTPDPQAQLAAVLNQANRLRTGERYNESLQLYDQAIALDATNVEALWGRCYNLNRLQRVEEAIASCDAALQIEPNNPQALWSKGYALDQQQNHQGALQLYDQAIAQQPDFAEAWSNKGTALLLLGRAPESITAFDRAIQLDSTLAEAWNNRGAALWSAGRQSEAIASIDKAIELKPDYADALSLRQQMRDAIGR
ncbi:tetratricopeptide repeat protein [Oculatella sp. LEGE 06141]|uniref:serine/threonine-protein kinase n=1 Tax=Oculatella sp. LEGE 06141 TaxID=1828648 RepID=UPI001882240F|nr:serine/threonine-protein kinase [Oculatella sp. LEGE 06141]MBE9179706.1 tetratricopeptide repeat protein [Oculatella sp. LEGE 06141]